MDRGGDRWQRLFYQVLLVGGALALVLWLTIRLRVVTAPMIVGFFIAFALHPLVVWLRRRRVPAMVALTVPLAAVIGFGVVAIAFIVPNLASELVALSQKLPGRLQTLLVEVDPYWEATFAVKLSALIEPNAVRQTLQGIVRELVGPATSMLGWVLTSARDLGMALIYILLVFVVAAFLIDDYDRIVARIRDLVPPASRTWVETMAGRIDETLKGFLRGELLLFLLATVVFTTGLLALGVDFAALIGPLVALIYLVPYVGVVVGTLLALMVALLEAPSWGTFGGVLTLFLSFYAIDLLFITPRLIGGRVGLRPLVVLLGVVAGGELLGVMGVLLAVPCLAVGRIVLLECLAWYRSSDLYGAPTESPGAASTTPEQVADEPLTDTAPPGATP